MKEMDEREERWIAYYLGESSPDEKEAIEAELRESPKKREEFNRLIQGVKAWAKAPVAARPLDISQIGIETVGAAAVDRKGRFARSFSLALGMAAAALFVFALSQIQFSLQFSGTTIVWGKSLPAERLDELQAQVARNAISLEQVNLSAADNSRQIKDIVLTNLAMRDIFAESTAQLVRMQEIESQTRYKDMQGVLTLVGNRPTSDNPWTNVPGFTDGANGENGVIKKNVQQD